MLKSATRKGGLSVVWCTYVQRGSEGYTFGYRALFGEQDECITTLQAWQQMTHEAKWFGRALYDAEEFVLKTCLPSLEV